MENLPTFIGEMVSLSFICYANESWNRIGKLVEIEPYSHVVIDPYEYRKDVGDVTGDRFYEETEYLRKLAIYFVKEWAGIQSIKKLVGDGTEELLYQNQWIIPRFNPLYKNTRGNLVERGAIKIGENADDIEFHVRKLSFGKELATRFKNQSSEYDPHHLESQHIR